MNDHRIEIDDSITTRWQGIGIFLGDDQQPVMFGDGHEGDDIRDLIPHPLQRLVAIARLKFVIAALNGDY